MKRRTLLILSLYCLTAALVSAWGPSSVAAGKNPQKSSATSAINIKKFAWPDSKYWPGARFAIQGEFKGQDTEYLKGLEEELRNLYANGIANIEIQADSVQRSSGSAGFKNVLKVFYSVGNELGMAMDLRVGGAGGIKGGTPQALYSSDTLPVHGGHVLKRGTKITGTTVLASDNTFDEKLIAVIAVKYTMNNNGKKVQKDVVQLDVNDFKYESVVSENQGADSETAAERGRGDSMPQPQGNAGSPQGGMGAPGEGPGGPWSWPGAPRGNTGGPPDNIFSGAFSFGASATTKYDVTVTYVGKDIVIGKAENEDWDILAYYKATDKDIGGMDNTDFYSNASAEVIIKNTENLFDDELKALIKKNAGLFAVDGGDRNQRLSSDTWSDELPAKIKRLYGYDFINYLAVQYTGYTLEDAGAAERLNNDWKESYCYLFGDYLTILEKWASEKYDSGFRCQIGFSTMLDTGIVTQYVTQADVESFWPSGGSSIRDFNLECGYLPVVSVSNILRRKVTAGNELGAMYGAHTGSWTDFLLTHVNKAIYSGVNRILYHVVESQYGNSWAYGYDGGMMNWGSINPQYVAESEFNAYVARLQYILQNGTAERDFIVYDHTYDDDYRTSYIMNNSVEEAGYNFDIFSPGLMRTKNGKAVRKGVIDPTGGRYRAFVITNLLNGDTMPMDAAETILNYARNGVPIVVVGKNNIPKKTMSFGTIDRDNDLAGIFKEVDRIGKLTVIDSQDQLVKALYSLGVEPNVKKDKGSRIVSYKRVSDDGNTGYYFLFNYATDKEVSTVRQQISLKGAGTPYLMDLWSGKVTEIANYMVTDDGYITVDVALDPNDTCMIALTNDKSDKIHAADLGKGLSFGYDEHGNPVLKAKKAGNYNVGLSDGTTASVVVKSVANPIKLDAWDLKVEAWYSKNYTSNDIKYGVKPLKKEISAKIDGLIPWDEIKEIGQGVSGVGTYTATFALDGDFDGAILSLGSVYDTVLVYINDKQVYLDQTSLTADLSEYLVKGKNTLVVVAPSDLQNMILANGGENSRNDSYQKYGLLGPVTVTPYVNARLK